MKSELIHAFKTACGKDPSLNAENVGDLFADEIEQFLPSLIKQINLPPRKTLWKKRLEEITLIRTRKKSRDKKSKSIRSEDTVFIEALRIAQYRLNGHDSSSNLYFEQNIERQISSSGGYLTLDNPDNFITYPFAPTEDLIDRLKIPLSEEPYIIQDKYRVSTIDTDLTDKYEHNIQLPPVIKVTIEKSIKNKYKKDEYFKELIDTIKEKAKNILELSNKSYNVNISLIRDMELPEWEKIIIVFNVPDLGFDEKIMLWDIIDRKIREEIKSLRSARHPYSKRRPRLDDLNKNLFIKILSS